MATQLLYVAARFAEFAGWVNQDAGDLREAMRWSNAALDYAQEAEDSHLTSYIQMRKSSIASDANRTATCARLRARGASDRIIAIAASASGCLPPSRPGPCD